MREPSGRTLAAYFRVSMTPITAGLFRLLGGTRRRGCDEPNRSHVDTWLSDTIRAHDGQPPSCASEQVCAAGKGCPVAIIFRHRQDLGRARMGLHRPAPRRGSRPPHLSRTLTICWIRPAKQRTRPIAAFFANRCHRVPMLFPSTPRRGRIWITAVSRHSGSEKEDYLLVDRENGDFARGARKRLMEACHGRTRGGKTRFPRRIPANVQIEIATRVLPPDITAGARGPTSAACRATLALRRSPVACSPLAVSCHQVRPTGRTSSTPIRDATDAVGAATSAAWCGAMLDPAACMSSSALPTTELRIDLMSPAVLFPAAYAGAYSGLVSPSGKGRGNTRPVAPTRVDRLRTTCRNRPAPANNSWGGTLSSGTTETRSITQARVLVA